MVIEDNRISKEMIFEKLKNGDIFIYSDSYLSKEVDDYDSNTTIEFSNLIDLVEMICDWKAASERHADGDIYKSIEINQQRFGYSDELKIILKNTIDFLEGVTK